MKPGFWQEFRAFAVKGNVIDMAVGIIVGGAFTLLVNSLVNNIMNPVLGVLTGGVDFSNLFVVLKQGSTPGPYATLEAANKAGAVTLSYGLFINAIISFLIISLAVFLLVRSINRLQSEFERDKAVAKPSTKQCPYCLLAIPEGASKCGHCTADLPQA